MGEPIECNSRRGLDCLPVGRMGILRTGRYTHHRSSRLAYRCRVQGGRAGAAPRFRGATISRRAHALLRLRRSTLSHVTTSGCARAAACVVARSRADPRDRSQCHARRRVRCCAHRRIARLERGLCAGTRLRLECADRRTGRTAAGRLTHRPSRPLWGEPFFREPDALLRPAYVQYVGGAVAGGGRLAAAQRRCHFRGPDMAARHASCRARSPRRDS